MLGSEEQWAGDHPDQYRGCVACKKSHHETAFCKCGRCFFQGEVKQVHLAHGLTIVKCACGRTSIWD
jgi:hypothetical protein